jgi:hypothetical protein
MSGPGLFFFGRLSTLTQYSLGTIRQQEEIEGIQIGKEELKPSLFVDNMILYPKGSENYTKKLLDIINIFIKVMGYKINLQKLVAFLYTNNEQIEKDYRKIILFTIASKSKIPRNKQQ